MEITNILNNISKYIINAKSVNIIFDLDLNYDGFNQKYDEYVIIYMDKHWSNYIYNFWTDEENHRHLSIVYHGCVCVECY